MKLSLLILATILLFTQCQSKESMPTDEANLGQIDFQVSGSEEALPYFQEGLLLLHSFEFEDAAEKFIEAQRLDSNFVMAYWGEAMSYNHPLWRERFSEEGTSALNKLAKTPDERAKKASVPLERELLEAVEILYSAGDKKKQDIAYKNQMEKLYKKYPENHEVAAFYALSLLGSSKNRDEDDNHVASAKIVQSIIDENPNHPGALHYLIHSYDDPDHATLALDAASSYAQVAPDAEHALHMPSHIFVALGMWEEVVKSNVASYSASVERMKAKELGNDARGYHACKWLMYGYLQQGKIEEARRLVYDMKKYAEETPSSKARAHYIMMKADYLVESDTWSDSIAYDHVDIAQLNLLTQGVEIYTHGMAGYKANQKESLRKSIARLDSMASISESLMVAGAAKMCSGVSSYLQPPSVNEVESLRVLEYELRAMLAMLDDDQEIAEKWLKLATETEDKTEYTYGPPNIVKPSFELYGEWLVSTNRNKEATLQFEKILERAPKRRLAMQGMKKTKS